MHADEPELIRRAQRDPRAFGPLYDRYVRRIYAFACRRTGDEALAQDVTAATFEKAGKVGAAFASALRATRRPGRWRARSARPWARACPPR